MEMFCSSQKKKDDVRQVTQWYTVECFKGLVCFKSCFRNLCITGNGTSTVGFYRNVRLTFRQRLTSCVQVERQATSLFVSLSISAWVFSVTFTVYEIAGIASKVITMSYSSLLCPDFHLLTGFNLRSLDDTLDNLHPRLHFLHHNVKCLRASVSILKCNWKT